MFETWSRCLVRPGKRFVPRAVHLSELRGSGGGGGEEEEEEQEDEEEREIENGREAK